MIRTFGNEFCGGFSCHGKMQFILHRFEKQTSFFGIFSIINRGYINIRYFLIKHPLTGSDITNLP